MSPSDNHPSELNGIHTGTNPDIKDETALSLLKEYAEKLSTLADNSENLWHKRSLIRQLTLRNSRAKDVELQIRLFYDLRPTAERLARYVSERLEYARFDDLRQIEWKLRSVELENAILHAEKATKHLENDVRLDSPLERALREVRWLLLFSIILIFISFWLIDYQTREWIRNGLIGAAAGLFASAIGLLGHARRARNESLKP